MEKELFEPYVDSISLTDKLNRFVWGIVCLIFFRPFALPVFNSWRLGLLRLFGAKIGKGSIVYSSAYIPAPWNLVMGEISCIGPEVQLHIGKTILGSKVTISQRSYLCSASHLTTSKNTPFVAGTVVVRDYAWVAAEAFVMMGIEIGEGAVVGARSAVFKNVEPWTIVGGNPAKFLKRRVIYD
ncbi:putative colanic acid biosynthesis acetyltransferase [Dyadobacter bucti]|uniref:putative colanic acid biosynthesis acetyltransferase n=1 Tax=Dyadobacter bucti TaxID=2572203 RepID=UPI003F700CED